jgi:proteasome lid subunit RPN8/RPN11
MPADRDGLLHFSLDVIVPQIIEIGMAELPKEACGIIIPELGLPSDQWVRQMANRSPSPETSYAIDPETIAGLLRYPEAWQDVIVWHTHPSGHVGPSRDDLKTRREGLRYLVVSLPRGEKVMY